MATSIIFARRLLSTYIPGKVAFSTCPSCPRSLVASRKKRSAQTTCHSVRYQTTGGGTGGGSDYQLGPSQDVQPQPNTQSWGGDGEADDPKSQSKPRNTQEPSRFKQTAHRMFESAMTTTASLFMLGLAGYGYHKYYKHLVLQKIYNAFEPGDPMLVVAAKEPRETATLADAVDETDEHWLTRSEQPKIDSIVAGNVQGHYYLILGEKGVGKTSMLLEAMRKVDGHGISMLEAHADLEIFRVRLGKALDFEYHEDYIGSLFSIRGPRDTTALLDIERAFNKLEKVAVDRRKKFGKPIVMIINSVHLLRDDDDGRDLLELVQQRAEAWSAAGLVTVIFNTDDYWIYERLKQYGTRMEVISIRDLPPDKAMGALAVYRKRYFGEAPNEIELEEVYKLVGGRLSFLNRVARSKDMLKKCQEICRAEKTWLLNQAGLLGMEMDDDVMDQQKFASAAMVLCKALVDQEAELNLTYTPEKGHQLPELPLFKAREVCTRADFMQSYDHMNLFTIDSAANVRADSVPMANAMREICNEPGFEKKLNATLDRISDIESLGRTRELVMKDLRYDGKYNFTIKNYKGAIDKTMVFTADPGERPEDDEDEKEEQNSDQDKKT